MTALSNRSFWCVIDNLELIEYLEDLQAAGRDISKYLDNSGIIIE